MTKTAVAYLRLSQDGKSIDRQRREVEEHADENGYELVEIYNEGRRSSGFDEDRPEYQSLLEHVETGEVDAVIVPNLSRLSRDRKHRIRLLLDLDAQGVDVCVYELGRTLDMDDDWELVQQAVTATTDDVGKRKEIERSQRETAKRLERGYDHGRPPFGLTYDDAGEYWVPGEEFDAALEVIERRDEGASWREIEDETGVNKDTARRIFDRREKYLQEV